MCIKCSETCRPWIDPFVIYSSDAGAAGREPRYDLYDREPSVLGGFVVARQVPGQRNQGLPSESAERA